jgi:hypothetical protein
MFPLTRAACKPIVLRAGCDVTNQTVLYPGVTVDPGAVVGVFTYAPQDKHFAPNSITQVRRSATGGRTPAVPEQQQTGFTGTTASPRLLPRAQPSQGSVTLRPGNACTAASGDIESGAPDGDGAAALAALEEAACARRRVSPMRYAVFTVLYAAAIWALLPLTDAILLMPLWGGALLGMYTGGFLLLAAALPVSFIVAVGSLLLWLVLVKRCAEGHGARGRRRSPVFNASRPCSLATLSVWSRPHPLPFALASRIFIRRCVGSHPLYTYKSTAWMAYVSSMWGGLSARTPWLQAAQHKACARCRRRLRALR